MSEFVRICGKADLPAKGEVCEVVAGDKTLCVANIGGLIRAVDNVCPHRQGPLGQGIVEHGKVVCPWHGWAFDLETGVSAHSAAATVEVYAIRVEGDDVLAEL